MGIITHLPALLKKNRFWAGYTTIITGAVPENPPDGIKLRHGVFSDGVYTKTIEMLGASLIAALKNQAVNIYP